MKRSQLLEKPEVEDLRWTDGEQDHIVPPELPAELVVDDAYGVIFVQEAIGRSFDPEPGELRTESGSQQQQRSDHRPRVPGREPAPAHEATIDDRTDLHHACHYMSDRSYSLLAFGPAPGWRERRWPIEAEAKENTAKNAPASALA